MDNDRINALEVAVARIETKIDTVLGLHTDSLADHENRIRTLEKAKWRIAGAAGAIGAVTTAVVSYLPGIPS